MNDLFVKMLLGHFAGDYLLQSKEMAIKKSERSWQGFLWCFFHCAIYTLTICLILRTLNPLIITLIFLSHFPIDRWSLANKWLDFIGGRNILTAHESKDKRQEIDIAFSCFVYAVADNTMHLILLYWITFLI